MNIKNYYIKNDFEYIIINDIIKYLINNNINYLYIKETNELHFDNYIFRFKKDKNVKELLFNELLNIIDNLYKCGYDDFSEYSNFITKNTLYEKNNFKNIQKISNIKVNTKGNIKKLNRQLNPTRKIYK